MRFESGVFSTDSSPIEFKLCTSITCQEKVTEINNTAYNYVVYTEKTCPRLLSMLKEQVNCMALKIKRKLHAHVCNAGRLCIYSSPVFSVRSPLSGCVTFSVHLLS